ncbi:MAG: hypothetical protein ABS70_01860 [Nitrospira sp. SCN 59-13]|nr:MAG: hypothetical protein ABS70_01860 [Nitrospira sp. SCN 59-13]
MNGIGTLTGMVMVTAVFFGATPVFAQKSDARSPLGERAVLQAGQVVQGDYFAFGPQVEISGIVNGDLYAAGGEVIVDGVINGDVIVAGTKVVLSGAIAQDARVVGAHITVSGTIGRNATLAGVDVHLTETATVRENVIAGGGSVQLSGAIGRDARVGAWHATFSNGIERDVIVAAESVRLTSKASVGGRLRYWGEVAPSIDQEAVVRGPITRRPLPEGWSTERARQGLIGMRVLAAFASFLSTLLLGLILLRVCPQFVQQVAGAIRERPAQSVGWGLTALVVTPLVAISFLVTMVMLPAGVVLLALYGVAVYLTRIFAIIYAGQWLFRRQDASSSLARPFVVGLLLYSLLTFVPIIGGLVTLFTVMAGLGGLLVGVTQRLAVAQEQNLAEGTP